MSEQILGHLRPDLIEKLVDAITNLIWGKQQVISFFRNAGVPDNLLNDYEEQLQRDKSSVKKPIMIRTILHRMNDSGDKAEAIRMRREVVRRVIEWKDFSTCQPDCQDLARGAIAAVCDIVGKYDFLTEIRNERERQQGAQIREEHKRREEIARQRTAWEAAKTAFMACFGIAEHSQRGRAFEAAMNGLFVHANLAAEPPFTVFSESGDLSSKLTDRLS
jgi:restriction system protein